METGDHFAMAAPLRAKWQFDVLFVERQFYGKTLVEDARNAGIPVAELTADTDKVTRAIPAAARLHAGKVWWPAHGIYRDATGLDWVESEWEPELLAFDKGSSTTTRSTPSATPRGSRPRTGPRRRRRAGPARRRCRRWTRSARRTRPPRATATTARPT